MYETLITILFVVNVTIGFYQGYKCDYQKGSYHLIAAVLMKIILLQTNLKL